MKKRPEFKKIIDHNNPTKSRIRQVLKMRQDNSSGLIIPDDLDRCQICTKFFGKGNGQIYWGQEFCTDCVEAMKSGAKINES